MNNKTADKLYKVGRKILWVFTAYLIFLLGWMAYSIVRTWNNPAYGSEKLSVRIIDLVTVLWFVEIQLIIFILLMFLSRKYTIAVGTILIGFGVITFVRNIYIMQQEQMQAPIILATYGCFGLTLLLYVSCGYSFVKSGLLRRRVKENEVTEQ